MYAVTDKQGNVLGSSIDIVKVAEEFWAMQGPEQLCNPGEMQSLRSSVTQYDIRIALQEMLRKKAAIEDGIQKIR